MRQEQVENDERAGSALRELISDWTLLLRGIGDAQENANGAVAEIQKGNANAAIRQHGEALNRIKDMSRILGTAGLKRAIADYAKKYGADPKRLEKDPEVRRLHDRINGEVKQLREELDTMTTQIEELFAQGQGNDPTTTNDNPTYRANLKRMTVKYKDVADLAKDALGNMKRNHATIAKLKTIAQTASPDKVPQVIATVRRVCEALCNVRKELDDHIQETIRLPDKGYIKECRDLGLTEEDQGANLRPHRERAFSMNYQCKNIRDDGIEKLSEVLEFVIEHSNSDEARALLEEINTL